MSFVQIMFIMVLLFTLFAIINAADDSVRPCENFEFEAQDCINMALDKCIVNIAGYNYDLRPLEKSSGNMVSGKDDYDYYFNFCEEIFTYAKRFQIGQRCGSSGAYMVSKDGESCHRLADPSRRKTAVNFFNPLTGLSGPPESGISFMMNDPVYGRAILIRLNCEPNDTPPREIGWSSQGKLQISWNTPHGCPIKDVDDSHNESTKSIGSPDESVNIPHVVQDSGYINHHNATLNVTDGSCNTVYSIDEVICYGVRLYRNGISGRKLIESFDNTICIFTIWLIVTNKRLHIVDDERKFAKDIIKWFIQLRLMSWLITTYPH